MAKYNLTSNFNDEMKSQFNKDTGLNANQSQAEYINYVAAKSQDMQMQLMNAILHELSQINEHLRKG